MAIYFQTLPQSDLPIENCKHLGGGDKSNQEYI